MLETPYKLCDYRPMYGLIFEDYLNGYQYWGHCDNDLIFGCITNFVSDEQLERYDRIFTRGHLTIYRNIDEVNRFFQKDSICKDLPSWHKVVSSSTGYVFDEWLGTSRMWKTCCPDRMYDEILFDEILFDDISIASKHFLSYQKQNRGLDKGKSHFLFEYDNGKLYRWYWDEQKKCIGREQTLYAHFQKRDFTVHANDTNHYLIVPNRFLPYETLTKDFVFYYGRKYLFYSKYIQIR